MKSACEFEAIELGQHIVCLEKFSVLIHVILSLLIYLLLGSVYLSLSFLYCFLSVLIFPIG